MWPSAPPDPFSSDCMGNIIEAAEYIQDVLVGYDKTLDASLWVSRMYQEEEICVAQQWPDGVTRVIHNQTDVNEITGAIEQVMGAVRDYINLAPDEIDDHKGLQLLQLQINNDQFGLYSWNHDFSVLAQGWQFYVEMMKKIIAAEEEDSLAACMQQLQVLG